MNSDQEASFKHKVRRMMHENNSGASEGPHLTDVQVADYLTGLASEDERAAIDSHLERCASCAAELEQVDAAMEAWRGEEGEARLAALADRMKEAILASADEDERPRLSFQFLLQRFQNWTESAPLAALIAPLSSPRSALAYDSGAAPAVEEEPAGFAVSREPTEDGWRCLIEWTAEHQDLLEGQVVCLKNEDWERCAPFERPEYAPERLIARIEISKAEADRLRGQLWIDAGGIEP